MHSEYSAESHLLDIAEIEDFGDYSELTSASRKAMLAQGFYLIAISQLTVEEVQTELDKIDEPTQDEAEDKADEVLQELLEEKMALLRNALGMEREDAE